MEGSKLFRHAENWLNNNPGKNLRDYRKETGYSGPPLKLRQRKGDPIRVSYKGKSSQAQILRSIREKPKTPEEASYLRQIKRQSKEISQSTLHQFATDGRPSVAEHDVRLASGGTNEYLSISDPDFAAFKTKIESKLPAGYVADIDNVTGGVRIIPEQYHNKFRPTSKQPGFTLEMGDDIDRLLLQIPSKPAIPPEFDVSGIKSGQGIPIAKPKTRRIPRVPQNPVVYSGGGARFNPANMYGAFGTPGGGGQMAETDPLGILGSAPIMLP